MTAIRQTAALALALLCLAGLSHGATILSGGSVTSLNEVFQTITFDAPFDRAPVIVPLLDRSDTNPTGVRIKNVTATGFDIAQVEPFNSAGPASAQDGATTAGTAHFLAVLPGTHLIEGVLIEAGSVDTQAVQVHNTTFPTRTESWESVNFSAGFAAAPSVMSFVQTMNNESTITGNNSAGNVSTPFVQAVAASLTGDNAAPDATGLRLALERAQIKQPTNNANVLNTGGSVDETIGWIAISQGTGTLTDKDAKVIRYESAVTADDVDEIGGSGGTYAYAFAQTFSSAPLVAGSILGRDGDDGGWMRRATLSAASVELFIQEDQVVDDEVGRSDNPSGLFAFSESFSVANETVFQTGFAYTSEPTPAEIGNDAANLNGAIGQVGTFSGAVPDGISGQFAPDLMGFAANNRDGGRLLWVDRPTADGAFDADLASDVLVDGAVVSFDVATRRTQGGTNAKDYDIIGYDKDGKESFHLRVIANNTSPNERLAVLTGGGATLTTDLIGTFGGTGADANQDLINTGGVPAADELATITLTLGDTGYTIDFLRPTTIPLAYTTGEINYNGSASELSRIEFTFSGDPSGTSVQSGYFLDNITVSGEVVPEPSTLALAALGLLGLRRRRRARG